MPRLLPCNQAQAAVVDSPPCLCDPAFLGGGLGVWVCFPLLPREFLSKISTHACTELKGKEFVQTIRKAELEALRARVGCGALLPVGRRVSPA